MKLDSNTAIYKIVWCPSSENQSAYAYEWNMEELLSSNGKSLISVEEIEWSHWQRVCQIELHRPCNLKKQSLSLVVQYVSPTYSGEGEKGRERERMHTTPLCCCLCSCPKNTTTTLSNSSTKWWENSRSTYSKVTSCTQQLQYKSFLSVFSSKKCSWYKKTQ